MLLSYCVPPLMKPLPVIRRQSAGRKLAACVTLLPGATSLYYWEGKLEQEYEVQMLLKTNLANQQALWTASNLIILTKPRSCWYCQWFMAITTISHGSTLPYADPAAVQHVSFAGLFDAPGRSNFIPADRAFVFDFQQNQHDLYLTRR